MTKLTLPEMATLFARKNDKILDIGGKNTHEIRDRGFNCDACSITDIHENQNSYDIVLVNNIFEVEIFDNSITEILLDVQGVLINKGLFFCNFQTGEEYYESLLRLFAHTHDDYGGKVVKIGKNSYVCRYVM